MLKRKPDREEEEYDDRQNFLLLVIIGALNWGSVALFQLDLVAYLFGGSDAMISRVVYALVALGGIWCISLLFREPSARQIRDH